MELAGLGEFGLIERLKERYGVEGGSLVRGIGDDTAVVETEGHKLTLVTTDMLVEGVHFDLQYTSPLELGKKCLAVNISDMAAMGGTPRWFLVSLGLPRDIEAEFVEQLYSGLSEIAKEFGVKLIGGDTVASDGKVVINVVLLGDAAGTDVVYRRGARPGDRIFATGTLGDSAAGLKLLKDGIREGSCNEDQQFLLSRHLTPTPRVKEGLEISGKGLATSMIDISDGLAQDLGHICSESGVQGKVRVEKLPLSKEYMALGREFGFADSLPLTGGEDYELLFTVPIDRLEEMKGLTPSFTCGVTEIGEICEGAGVIAYNRDEPVNLDSGGYDHFKA